MSFRRRNARAFTLLEVMIAVAVIGIAMLALLGLHQEDLRSVIQAQELSQAAMLAQTVMSQAELQRFPPPGVTKGDFSRYFPDGRFKNFRWQMAVVPSTVFQNIVIVNVTVFYGGDFGRKFNLVELMRNPMPPGPRMNPSLGARPPLGATSGSSQP